MRHGRMHIIASVKDLGVVTLPVSVTFDCGNHLLFDLTHESEEKGLGLRWGRLPSTSIQYTILGVVPVLCAGYPTVTSVPFVSL